MNSKVNYFKIGLFTIISIALIVASLIIFGSGLFAKEKVYFETYFDQSVHGLNVGSPVLNMGVRFGRVENITFARNEYLVSGDPQAISRFENYVIIICSVDEENLPAATYEQRKIRVKRLIKKGLRLRLATNILTGQGYLEATYLDPGRFPPMEIGWEPKWLYIPSAPGAFTTIKHSIDKILHKLEKIDTEKIGKELENMLTAITDAVHDANVGQVSARLNKTLDDVDSLIVAEKPRISQTIENFRQISANIKDLTEDLKRHPSELIFSKPPPKSEVYK